MPTERDLATAAGGSAMRNRDLAVAAGGPAMRNRDLAVAAGGRGLAAAYHGILLSFLWIPIGFLMVFSREYYKNASSQF